MMTIQHEITVDVGEATEKLVTLWLVSYSDSPDCEHDHWCIFVEALAEFCAEKGWHLECGGNPCAERRLAIFAEGHEWPDDDVSSSYLPL